MRRFFITVCMLSIASMMWSGVFTVTSVSDTGAGSLRNAILSANSSFGEDTILFSLPGSGFQTIELSSDLPSITSKLFIDGYSQSGSSPNTNYYSFNASIQIAIDGGGAHDGIHLGTGSSGSRIAGLRLVDFDSYALRLSGNTSGHHIGGNLFGTNPDGSAASGANAQIQMYAAESTLGGYGAESKNVISGCYGRPSVLISGGNAVSNHILNNFIGLSSDGDTPIGGIGAGIRIESGASDISIGENWEGYMNHIYMATGPGIEVLGNGTSVDIQPNAIGSCTGLAIDLGSDGPTLNDVGDTDWGPNDLQNVPTIVRALSDDRLSIYAEISYQGAPNRGHRIDWYKIDSPNMHNRGDMQRWLGSSWLDTDGTGSISAEVTVGRWMEIDPGDKITATITPWGGGTSEPCENFTIGLGALEVVNMSDVVNGDVDNVLDLIANPGADGISLREAFLAANAQDYVGWGVNHFMFDIPGSTPHVFTPNSALPPLVWSSYVDGWSEPDNGGPPVVVIDGNQAGSGADGLVFNSGWCEASALSVVGFDGDGIVFNEPYGTLNTIYIGVMPDGSTAMGNGGSGLRIQDSYYTRVGNQWDDLSIISGNGVDGVSITGSDSYGIELLNIHIGTDRDGLVAIPNARNGVRISSGANGNSLGGALTERLVVSGNGESGIFITGSNTNQNRVMGNQIGLGSDGVTLVPNGSHGIHVEQGANQNWIGIPGIGNTISGNSDDGLRIWSPVSDSCLTHVVGNIIGLDHTGTLDRGNGGDGVHVSDTRANLIGGETAEERNIVSGNSGNGIRLTSAGSDANQVIGNYIGTDVSGMLDRGNDGDGISLYRGPDNNQIGGAESGEGNLISGNGGDGIQLGAYGLSLQDNIIEGNLIGVNASGDAAIRNERFGINVLQGAFRNTIGGSDDGQGNLISGNGEAGIILSHDCPEHSILGNYIGTDVSGTSALMNRGDGVMIFSSNNVLSEQNVISGNQENGVYVHGSSAQGNLIQGNFIGTDITGLNRVGNRRAGVHIGEAQSNQIGGSSNGEGNIIGGNQENGILMRGSTCTDNLVLGNRIGIGIDGTSDVRNLYNGIRLSSQADGNVIGGTEAGAFNVISFNRQNGIYLDDVSQINIMDNLIGTDQTGLSAAGNRYSGIQIIDADSIQVGTEEASRLVIADNGIDGLRLMSSSYCTIQRCFIGTNSNGDAAMGNSGYGVQLMGDSNDNIIGTDSDGHVDEEEGNVISGNNAGMRFHSGSGADNVVAGNLIGTSATGLSGLGNDNLGIEIGSGFDNTRIGTDSDGEEDELERNVISGNNYYGIRLSSADNVTIAGNLFGLGIDSLTALPNEAEHIYFAGSSSNNVVGTASSNLLNKSARNIFKHGDRAAIVVNNNAQANRISQNMFADNAGLAIDLDYDEVTENDNGDTDSGPNALMNFPILDTVTFDGAEISVSGWSRPGAEIQFYLSDAGENPSPNPYAYDFGEGERFLFSATEGSSLDQDGTAGVYTDDGTGLGISRSAERFSIRFTPTEFAITDLHKVTALAIDSQGNTSEFGPAKSVLMVEDCTDGVDNDMDGDADCADSDCQLEDTDNDGVCDRFDLDDDNDGILDLDECSAGGRGVIDFSSEGSPDPVRTYSSIDGTTMEVTIDHQSPGSVQTDAMFGASIWGLYATNGIGGTSTITIDLSAQNTYEISFLIHHITGDDINGGDELEIFATTNQGTVLTNPKLTPQGYPAAYIISNGTATASSTANMISAIGWGTEDQQNCRVLFDRASLPVNEFISSVTILFRDVGGTELTHGIGLTEIQLAASCSDVDLDGVEDHLDLDSDNDGIYDALESGSGQSMTAGALSGGVDIFGIPLSVSDGIGGVSYVYGDADSDDVLNPYELDSDADGCFDVVEAGFSDGNADGQLGEEVSPQTDQDGVVIVD